jgi:CheY-like chemotaxis protein
MPGMGGVGFLRRITDAEGRRQCPVLVLTARSLMKDFFDTLEVDGFVPKPCDEAGLESEIWRILDKTDVAARVEADRKRVRKVLIGDDDTFSAQRVAGALRSAGYEVEVVGTGPHVLEKAPIFKPDVVAMRDILSGLNGQKVISLLAIMPSTRTVPTVLYGWTPDPNKPFSPQPLGEMVRCLSSVEPTEIVRAVQAAAPHRPA